MFFSSWLLILTWSVVFFTTHITPRISVRHAPAPGQAQMHLWTVGVTCGNKNCQVYINRKSKLTAAPNDQIGALEFLFFTNFFLEYSCFPMICGISKALIFLFGKKVSFFPWCQANRDKVSSLHPVVIENQVGTKSLENNRGKRCWRESYHIFLLPES